MNLTIYRPSRDILELNIAADNVATYTHSLMAEHKVVCQFTSPVPLDLKKQDYIIVNGVKFKLNLPPEITKTNIFSYDCTFESPIYDSYRKVFMDEGSAEFDYNAASPMDIMNLWLTNMNEIDPGWTLGQVEDVPVQNFTFANVKCREAINTIATQFGLEWFCINKEIHLVKKAGFETNLKFQYGKGYGLYQLTRKNIDNKNIVTKLYAYGSDRNIGYTYRNGAKRLTFTGSPLTQNVDSYGIEEGAVNFDDIYPKREGKVTAVGEGSLSITDSSLDFNINDYPIVGTTAKISFLDGDFAGVTFEIAANGYDPATKTIKINPYTDDTGYTYPNDNRQAHIGDTYILLDIKMPESYIADAENELKARAEQYLAENSVPQVQYGLSIDPINARKRAIHLTLGDRVLVVDTKLGINAKIRITAISYPLWNPYQITATIADKVEPTLIQRLIAGQTENSKQIGWVDQRREEGYRRGYQNQQRLQNLIFDPSGDYFDPGLFKPGSIETLMLSVGAKSQAFMLSGGRATVSNDNLKADFTATNLIHYNLKIDGLGNTWSIPSASLNIPDLNKPYYIYAKCSITELSGSWVVSEDQILVDSVPGYYMLSIGVIYAVSDGFRGVGLTYGFASINGRIITAGRIQSLDGTIYFDLDSNQFFFGDASSSIDWNVSNERAVTLNGTLIQRAPGVVGPVPLDRGAYMPGQTYFPGDRVFYDGQTYLYIGEASSDDKAPTDTDYWQISAAQGEKGDSGVGIQATTITYQGSTSGTVVPTGSWVSNPPIVPEGQYLWTRTVIKYTDNSTSTAYSVSKQGESGADGADGVGITGYTTTYQKSASGTVVPTGSWTTTIPAVAPSEFLWTRLVISYSNSTTSTSYSVGMMGSTGAKGQGVFKSLIYIRSNTQPATPTGGSYASPVPSGWSDGIPGGEEIIWASTRVFTSDGLAPQQSVWTTPNSTSDTADLDYEFSAIASPGNPTSNPGNWHDGSEATPADLWMALRTKSNGTWSGWSILKIKGENGEDGTTVLSTVIQYQISSSGTVIPTGTWVNTIPSVPVGQYLWTRTQINYSNDTTSTGYSVSRMGADGLDGQDGNGIVSTTVTYQKSSSGTVVPTGTWVTNPPATAAGEYLWTRTVITYTDNSTSTSYSIGRHGEKGEPGDNAIIGVLTNESHTIPTDVNGNNGNFTGANTKMVIYNGASDDSENWTVTAAKSSGITGSLSGKTYTVTAMTTDTGYVDLTATRSGYSTVTKRFILSKSKAGSNGEDGNDGTDATAYWLVNSVPAIAKSTSGAYTPASITVYGRSQTGTSAPAAYACRFIIQESTNGTSYTTKYTSSANEASKSYTPSAGIKLIKVQMYLAGGTSFLLDEQVIPIVADGVAGKGISSIATTYQVSASGTTPPTGTWTSAIPSVPQGQYLWARIVTTYTDSTTSTNYSVSRMGADGLAGNDGRGITSTTTSYQASSSGTTVPTGAWTATIPTVTAGQYLWTRIILNYTDSTSSTSYSVGMKGATGATGKGISGTAVAYQVSASGTTIPTGTWVSSVPTVPKGQYLWTRTLITYTDSTTSTGYSVSHMGNDGLDGEDGRGITSATTTYQKSSSGTTVPTGTWVSSPPATSAGEYLWTRTILTYTDSTTSTIYGVSRNGANGQDGTDGNYTEHRFAKNGSPTAPPTLATTNANPPGWTVAQPSVGLLEYMWMTTAVKTAAGALVTNWSTPARLTGPKGDHGPVPDYVGEWKPTGVYKGSDLVVQIVKYSNGIHYITRVDAGTIPAGTLPTNTAYWTSIGADFETIATGLLLANYAYIEKLIVKDLASGVPDPETGIFNVPYMRMSGPDDEHPNRAELDFWPAGTTPAQESNPASNALVRIGKGVGFMQYEGGNKPGVSARDAEGDDSYSEMTSEGIYTNGSNVSGLPSLSPSDNASIAASLFKRNNGSGGISAAIIGYDGTNSTHGTSESFGGWFNSLFAYGASFGAERISADYTLTDKDFFVTITSGGNTIYLPASPKKGQFYIIKSAGYSGNVLNDNSSSAKIIANSVVPQGSLNLWTGTNYFDMIFVWFDGTYWVANRFVTD